MARAKWKLATIITTALLVTVAIVVVVVAVVTVRDAMVLRHAVNQAVGATTMADNLHAVALPTPPLPTNDVTVEFARFAADLVVRLEMATNTPPVNPAVGTTVTTLDSDVGSQAGWVLQVDNQLWVVFRGTSTRAEWERDFALQQVSFMARAVNRKVGRIAYPRMMTMSSTPWEGTQVHTGFLNTYLSMQDAVLAAVANATNVCIAGHSLGGAMAQLAALDVATMFPNVTVNTITFGAPRVGNDAFATALTTTPNLQTLVCFANTADMVPNVPLAVQPSLRAPYMPWTYTHAGWALWLFTSNQGSWTGNHQMPVYVNYLDSLT